MRLNTIAERKERSQSWFSPQHECSYTLHSVAKGHFICAITYVAWKTTPAVHAGGCRLPLPPLQLLVPPQGVFWTHFVIFTLVQITCWQRAHPTRVSLVYSKHRWLKESLRWDTLYWMAVPAPSFLQLASLQDSETKYSCSLPPHPSTFLCTATAGGVLSVWDLLRGNHYVWECYRCVRIGMPCICLLWYVCRCVRLWWESYYGGVFSRVGEQLFLLMLSLHKDVGEKGGKKERESGNIG